MLHKTLGPLQIQLISLGGIIGSSFFLGLGTILEHTGASAIIAFSLGGLIVWLVALAISELSLAMVRKGSFISHSAELLGRPWAAGVGWAYWFNWCCYIPSEMLAGGMILHQQCPQISVGLGATCFGVVITGVNLLSVRYFGYFESWFAFIKIGAMILFSIIAVAIWGGYQGHSVPILSETLVFFPTGNLDFLVMMVLVLVNFQGTEIIALTAAEAQNPAVSIPRATRTIAFRTALLYVVPITLLILIVPRQEISGEQSPFSHALQIHGFSGFGTFFQWVIMAAALSCGNSGLYSAVRSLYGLGTENLAPRWVTRVTSRGIPVPATVFTVFTCWMFFSLYFFFENTVLYTWLLTVSGFTGSICWISISWCQLRLRNNMIRDKIPISSLPYVMPGFPFLSLFSLLLQGVCMGTLAFHPSLQNSLILGIPVFLIPMMFFWVKERKAKALTTTGDIRQHVAQID